jgi:hypothetical protein
MSSVQWDRDDDEALFQRACAGLQRGNGIKHDHGKPRFGLIPPDAELEVAKALTFGASKYDDPARPTDPNYKRVPPYRFEDAALRHVNAHRRGERTDHESGLHPLAHAIVDLLVVLQAELEAEKREAAK